MALNLLLKSEGPNQSYAGQNTAIGQTFRCCLHIIWTITIAANVFGEPDA